jgi:hypothetical protein
MVSWILGRDAISALSLSKENSIFLPFRVDPVISRRFLRWVVLRFVFREFVWPLSSLWSSPDREAARESATSLKLKRVPENAE